MQEAFKFAQQSFVGLREYYPYKGKANKECKQKKDQIFPIQKEGFSLKNLIPFIGGKAKKVKANDLDKFTEQIKVDRYWRIGQSY